MESSVHAFHLIHQGFALMPTIIYVIAFLAFLLFFLYNFLEIHFLEDAFTLFRGSPVHLSYNPASEICQTLVSKCHLLNGRYMATPWLSSPHIQTTFLNFHGRPPAVNYKREIFHTSDGGTFAMDWVKCSDVSADVVDKAHAHISHDKIPIVVVIPGLTSDSDSPYIRHLAFGTAKRGWNVVICNHRGLGGISMTSDCFYNAGWTKDTRDVINHLHHEYPNAPLFAVGTSMGANILVKYVGEDGEDVPIAGAVAVCSPWDLLLNSRFISRKLAQKLYDRALTIGLRDYAQLHQPLLSRLADWEGIIKSRSIRDFDNYATRLIGKYESVDTFYRHCSSAPYVSKVSVPLLCIGSLDDPLCTTEAIPWDECRENKNIVLATTRHGGHVAFFEGLTASTLWWVRAANEFLSVLHGSPFMHTQRKNTAKSVRESSIDKGPFVNVTNGMVAAISNDPSSTDITEDPSARHKVNDENKDAAETDARECVDQTLKQLEKSKPKDLTNVVKWLEQLFQQKKRLTRMLAYVAIISTIPLASECLRVLFSKRA